MDKVGELRLKLGLTDAPLPNEGLRNTVAFFNDVLRQDPMAWWQYLRGIDFHHKVEAVTLAPSTKLIRHESTGDRTLKPFSYYTDPGVSPFQTGTSFPGRQYKEFNVVVPTRALKSIASGISFSPTDRVSRVGGGAQYIIAFADAPKLLRVGEAR
jgi:hypothetical protein